MTSLADTIEDITDALKERNPETLMYAQMQSAKEAGFYQINQPSIATPTGVAMERLCKELLRLPIWKKQENELNDINKTVQVPQQETPSVPSHS